jgi:hypothetical protein
MKPSSDFTYTRTSKLYIILGKAFSFTVKHYPGLQGGYENLFTTRKRAQYDQVIVLPYTQAYYKIAPIHKKSLRILWEKEKLKINRESIPGNLIHNDSENKNV